MNNLNLNVEFCCTCLKVSSEKDKFLSLSFPAQREITYRNQLKFCVPEMGSEINIESYICKPCSIALENAYNFRCMCLNMDSKLDSIRALQQNNLKDVDGIREDLLQVLLKERDSKIVPKIGQSLDTSYLAPIKLDEDEDNMEVSRELGALLSESLKTTRMRKRKSKAIEDFSLSETVTGKRKNVSRNTSNKRRKKPLSDEELIKLACKTNPQLRNTPREALDCRVSLEKIVITQLPLIIPSVKTYNKRNKRKKESFYCDICDKTLKQRERYYSHVLKHSNIRAYKCEACPLKYFSADALRQHQKRIHNMIFSRIEPKVDPLKISIPKQSVIKETVSNRKSKKGKCVLKIKMGKLNSVTKVNTEDLFSCSECSYHTSSRSLYNQHTLEHLNTGKYVCEVCSKTFSSISNKNKHKRNLHKNASIRNRKKKKITVLPIQIKSEPITEPEPVIEPEPVMEPEPLMEPETIIEELEPITELQPFTITNVTTIIPFKCETCGEIFDHEDSYEVHRKIHIKKIEINGTPNINNLKPKKKKKKYFCTVCNAEFASRDHGNIHTGDKPYSCNICAKTFAAYTTLRKHRYTHTKKNIPEAQMESSTIHRCEICKQEFTKASDAISHTCKTSSGESVYRCQICKNAYVGRNALIDHMRMHLSETDETL